MAIRKRGGYLLQLPICSQCGRGFKRTAPNQRYCSDKCRRDRVDALRRDLANAFGSCSVQLAEEAIVDADRAERNGHFPNAG